MDVAFITPIQLDQFLKLSGIAGTGGQAKSLIQGGEVRVNGQIESRRGRKLQTGDVVSTLGSSWTVVDSRGPDPATPPS